MGHYIPPLRQLNEIERLVWSAFKKELNARADKKVFGSLSDNAKLFATYVSFAISPIPQESILGGIMLHYYKTLIDLSKSNGGFSIGKDIVTSDVYKPWQSAINKTYDK